MIITVHVKPHTNSLAIVVYPSPLGPRLRATNGGSGLGEKGSRFRCLLVYSHKLTNPWTIVNYPSCKEARISMMSTTWLEIRKDNWIHPWSKLSERWEEEPRTALLALTHTKPVACTQQKKQNTRFPKKKIEHCYNQSNWRPKHFERNLITSWLGKGCWNSKQYFLFAWNPTARLSRTGERLILNRMNRNGFEQIWSRLPKS